MTTAHIALLTASVAFSAILPGCDPWSLRPVAVPVAAAEAVFRVQGQLAPAPEEQDVAAVSASEALGATGAQDGTVRLWDLRRRSLVGELLTHRSPILALRFVSDPERLLSYSADGRLCSTRLRALGRPRCWQGPAVLAADISADGGTLGAVGPELEREVQGDDGTTERRRYNQLAFWTLSSTTPTSRREDWTDLIQLSPSGARHLIHEPGDAYFVLFDPRRALSPEVFSIFGSPGPGATPPPDDLQRRIAELERSRLGVAPGSQDTTPRLEQDRIARNAVERLFWSPEEVPQVRDDQLVPLAGVRRAKSLLSRVGATLAVPGPPYELRFESPRRLLLRRPRGVGSGSYALDLGVAQLQAIPALERPELARDPISEEGWTIRWKRASPGERWVAVSERGEGVLWSRYRVRIVDGRTQRTVGVVRGIDWASAAAFSPDERLLALVTGHALYVYEVSTGVERARLTEAGGEAAGMVFSASGDSLLLARPREERGEERRTCCWLQLWSWSTGHRISSAFHSVPELTGLALSPGADLAALATRSGAVRVARLGSSYGWWVFAEKDRWLVVDDQGYFDGSRRSQGMAVGVVGLQAISLDTLGNRANRPDRLLSALGWGEPAVVGHFARRHERRAADEGAAEEELSPLADRPLARLTALEPAGAVARLDFSLHAAGTPLRRYNLFVNNVPLFGSLGRELRASGCDPERSRCELHAEVPLARRPGRVELVAWDERNRASLSDFRALPGSSSAPQGRLFFLGFGVSQYQDPTLPDLEFTLKDVEELAGVLRAAGAEALPFRDAELDASAFEVAKRFLAQADRPDDAVVMLLSGHGAVGPTDDNFYFLGPSAQSEHPEETGIPLERFEALFDSAVGRARLLLIDACYSGVQDEARLGEERVPSEAGEKVGIKRISTQRAALDIRRYGRDRLIYTTLARRTGAVVLSASLGDEVSREDAGLSNGLFTRGVLEALRGRAADTDGDGRVSTRELWAAVASFVRERNPAQNPTIDRDNLEQEVYLPLARSTP